MDSNRNLQIQQAVSEALKCLPAVQAGTIAVRVRNGIVLLVGRLPGNDERRAAVQAAVRVPGVRAVVEEIDLG